MQQEISAQEISAQEKLAEEKLAEEKLAEEKLAEEKLAEEKRGFMHFVSFETRWGPLLLVPLAYFVAMLIRFLWAYGS